MTRAHPIAMPLLFLGVVFAASTVFASLPTPLNTTPLFLVVGILVLHRFGSQEGVTWFMASALFLLIVAAAPILALIHGLAGVLGAFLLVKIFAKRSLPALGGLALALAIVYGLIRLVTLSIAAAASGGDVALGLIIFQTVAIVLGVFGLSVAFTTIERWLQRRFFFRHET